MFHGSPGRVGAVRCFAARRLGSRAGRKRTDGFRFCRTRRARGVAVTFNETDGRGGAPGGAGRSRADGLDAVIRDEGEWAVLRVSGELDLVTSPVLRQRRARRGGRGAAQHRPRPLRGALLRLQRCRRADRHPPPDAFLPGPAAADPARPGSRRRLPRQPRPRARSACAASSRSTPTSTRPSTRTRARCPPERRPPAPARRRGARHTGRRPAPRPPAAARGRRARPCDAVVPEFPRSWHNRRFRLPRPAARRTLRAR